MDTHALKVDRESDRVRLDVFLAKNLPYAPSRNYIQKLIECGYVKVNETAVKARHKIIEGDDVLVEIPDNFLSSRHIAPENIPLDIVHEDEFLLVVNKPRGMLVHPAPGCYSGTLVNALLHHAVNLSNCNTDMRPGIVHRLDQETSGLLLVAKDNITHTKLAKQFQRHTVKKQYIALVRGVVEFDEGKIDAPIGRNPRHRELKAVRYDEDAKDAVTVYRVVKRSENKTLIQLFPKTGRTHQLRVHMAHLGHPVLGDDKYGRRNSFHRMALHSLFIGFEHPGYKKYVEYCTPVPEDFLI